MVFGLCARGERGETFWHMTMEGIKDYSPECRVYLEFIFPENVTNQNLRSKMTRLIFPSSFIVRVSLLIIPQWKASEDNEIVAFPHEPYHLKTLPLLRPRIRIVNTEHHAQEIADFTNCPRKKFFFSFYHDLQGWTRDKGKVCLIIVSVSSFHLYLSSQLRES